MTNTKALAKTAKTKRKQIDWELVEFDWRAGVKTKLQLSKEHNVSRAAMDKHFGALGIERDLNAKIQAKAKALVTKLVAPLDQVTENEIINVNARLVSDVLITHRNDIQRFRSIAAKMLDELSYVTDNKELFEQLGELLIDTTPNENGKIDQQQQKRLEALNRALDLSSRVDSLKKLSEVLKTIIGLEREAFSIGSAPPDPAKQVDDVMQAWAGTMNAIKEKIKATHIG